jgi:glycerate kinase
MKILIAPNSYKEVADSDKAAELFRRYLSKYTSEEIEILPISDGGDGFLKVCKSNFDLQILNYNVSTPYDESTFSCQVGYDIKGKRIFIESAGVLGLRVIPKEKRHPLNLSSKGLGDLLLRINNDIKQNKIIADEIIIGIGGTGINDLGLGVCSRFGIELYDIFGKRDEVLPEYYYRIKNIKWNKPDLPFKIKVILDVNNPLLGKNGATRTFGLQKGANKGELMVIELGFNKIINILKNKELNKSFNNLSGAGGGLAAGLYLFFDANSVTAGEFIGNNLRLNKSIDESDIVITGEGSFDKQTLDGKGAGIVLKLATEKNKRVFLCCGKIESDVKNQLKENVEVIEFNAFFNNAEESMNNFEEGIELASKKIVSLI